MNRFCCDHLCEKGLNCPLEFEDTVPDNDWLRRWMAENSSPCPPPPFADTEPVPPPSSGGLWVVLTALFVVAIFVLLGVLHEYR